MYQAHSTGHTVRGDQCVEVATVTKSCNEFRNRLLVLYFSTELSQEKAEGKSSEAVVV